MTSFEFLYDFIMSLLSLITRNGNQCTISSEICSTPHSNKRKTELRSSQGLVKIQHWVNKHYLNMSSECIINFWYLIKYLYRKILIVSFKILIALITVAPNTREMRDHSFPIQLMISLLVSVPMFNNNGLKDNYRIFKKGMTVKTCGLLATFSLHISTILELAHHPACH